MREILTQEEVDALLEAYDAGEIDDTPPGDASSTPFDFFSRKLVGGVQETLIQLIHDAAAKNCAAYLTGLVRRDVKVTNASAYTETAGGFLGNFKGRSCIGLLSADASPGHGFLAMSPFLAYGLVDLMLGGEGRIAEPDDRDFSVLEVRMVRKFMEGITSELTKGWNAIAPPARFTFVKVETNPKMLPAVPEQDSLYVMTYRIETDTGLSRDFSVAIPFALVEGLKGQGEPEAVDPMASEYAALLREAAEEIVVGVEVTLGEASLPIREILSLKPGDVITTDQEIDAPVTVLVEGLPKLAGRAGISRGNRAVKITAG